MNNKKYNHLGAKQQQGVVLIVALIMLLLITVLGVSAVNISRDKTQVAGNSMYTMLVYQGAESTLAKIGNFSSAQFYMTETENAVAKKIEVPQADLLDAGEVINGSSVMTSSAQVEKINLIGNDRCPEINGMANSTEERCFYYEFTAQTKLNATGAKTTHSEGRSNPKVKPN